MFSSPRWITSVFGLTLAASLAIAEKPLAAQTAAQDTSHKKGTMPMNMPMGNKTQKKKAASKSAKTKKPARGKETAKPTTKSKARGPNPDHAADGRRTASRASQGGTDADG